MNQPLFKLTVVPALELSPSEIEVVCNSLEELEVAEIACTKLLLLLQNNLRVMKSYTNLFLKYQLLAGVWMPLEKELTNDFQSIKCSCAWKCVANNGNCERLREGNFCSYFRETCDDLPMEAALAETNS